MRVFRSLDEVPPDFGPSALTIGNFDGVHAGHRRILRRVKEVAVERELKASALTFHPHPSKVVAPARAPRLMTSPEQRCALMQEEGIEQVLIMPFDRHVVHLSPEQFVEQVLVRKLGVRANTCSTNCSGERCTTCRSNGMISTCSMPSSCMRAQRCSGEVISRGARAGATTLLGCGWKVRAEALSSRSTATSFTRRRILRWPACTPSKLPMVSADGPKSGGTSSRLRKTRIGVYAAPPTSISRPS